MNAREHPSQEELKRLFLYDGSSGNLIWNVRRRKVPFGKPAGCIAKAKGNRTNYARIGISGMIYTAHRLIWIYHHGRISRDIEIDHIDGCGTNNRIKNLREVSGRGNACNARISLGNTSGITGVSWHKGNKKYRADIKIKGKSISLGYFNKLEDAAKARAEANIKYGFHELHGTVKAS